MTEYAFIQKVTPDDSKEDAAPLFYSLEDYLGNNYPKKAYSRDLIISRKRCLTWLKLKIADNVYNQDKKSQFHKTFVIGTFYVIVETSKRRDAANLVRGDIVKEKNSFANHGALIAQVLQKREIGFDYRL